MVCLARALRGLASWTLYTCQDGMILAPRSRDEKKCLPSPTGVSLVVSDSICRIKIALLNQETSSNPTLIISSANQNRGLGYCFISFTSILSYDHSHSNDDLRGLLLCYSENQKHFDMTTSRPKETTKRRLKFPSSPPPHFLSSCPNYCKKDPFSLVLPELFSSI